MAGTVYLRTNRFEIKLEGITFKTRDFESLCRMDFLFPYGKNWTHPPVVGLDVMHHPRDPSILLLLLCFGVGCVILKFGVGEPLPSAIQKFLSDKRIHFVGFGIPEKRDLFPFDDLGLTMNTVDIGYLAAKTLNDPKCKKWDLAELARKVLGIKRMIGLTGALSFERHEQIKCAICQLFITSVIGMGLLGDDDNKKTDKSYSSFLKNLISLQNLTEGWFKMPIGKKKKQVAQYYSSPAMLANAKRKEENFINAKCKEDYFINYFLNDKIPDDLRDVKIKGDSYGGSSDDLDKEGSSPTDKKPLKGILKDPSKVLLRSYSSPCMATSSRSKMTNGPSLKRANSKGCNVSFKCH